MDRSRWVSLVVVALYVAVDVFVPVPNFKSRAPSEGESFPGQDLGSFLAAVAFGLIWWPDFVDAVLLGARAVKIFLFSIHIRRARNVFDFGRCWETLARGNARYTHHSVHSSPPWIGVTPTS